MKLLINTLLKFAAGVVLVGALLFWPAGSWQYPGGWLLTGLLFVPMLVLGIVMLLKSPALLEKRLNGKEKESTQKGVVAFSGLIFVAGFVIAGLDFRFGWSHVPVWVTVLASVIFLLSYGLYAEVMRENAYLSRSIEVQEGQTVVDTGLYGVVRHPMYMATVLMYLAMPLVLGSWYSLLAFLCYPFVIAVRIRNEEQVLTAGLPGYADYKTRIRYKMIPFIW